MGVNLEEMTATEGVGYKFILVHKQKYCDSHSVCKGKDQFPDQATNVPLSRRGERGVYIPLGSGIRT